jgi:hypothetical protein
MALYRKSHRPAYAVALPFWWVELLVACTPMAVAEPGQFQPVRCGHLHLVKTHNML